MKSLVRIALLSLVAVGLCASAPAAEPVAQKADGCGSSCCASKAGKTKTAKKSAKAKKCACAAEQKTA